MFAGKRNRPSPKTNKVPATVKLNPMGAIEKIPRPDRPDCWRMVLAIRNAGAPMIVIVVPSEAANDIGLAALIAARIDDEVHLAVRRLSPRVSHLPKDSVVGRVLGRRGGELDAHPRVGADSYWTDHADDSETQRDENA